MLHWQGHSAANIARTLRVTDVSVRLSLKVLDNRSRKVQAVGPPSRFAGNPTLRSSLATVLQSGEFHRVAPARMEIAMIEPGSNPATGLIDAGLVRTAITQARQSACQIDDLRTANARTIKT